MKTLEAIVMLPLVFGIILLILPKALQTAKSWIALIISTLSLWYSILFYTGRTILGSTLSFSTYELSENLWRGDALSKLIILFVGIFTFLLIIYSIVYLRDKKGVRNYYSFLLLTYGFANAAAMANHMLIFLFSWSILAITLYLLIPSTDRESTAAANKSLIIIGASDIFLLLGIVIVWNQQGTWLMDEILLSTDSWIAHFAFFALLVGAFTKAGAFPFHTWIPDFTSKAPASSSGYLPASLDKLLGIYFLVRVYRELFLPSQGWQLAIIALGALTIIIGVMMALIQHNIKRLLGFHAVSQVGYMILGIGLGTALGLLGGLFHMINNAIYKSGLFMVAGNVQDKTQQDELRKLGGLSKYMPLTFAAALIFALSISGIPPLNGFASKWIIYQAIIEFGRMPGIASELWIVWLALAVIGSALTVASFVKFISGIFLGRDKKEFEQVKETHALMWIPAGLLALACIGFGVFASQYVLPTLFASIVGDFQFIGIWNSPLISVLLIVSIVLGLAFYGFAKFTRFRKEDSFIGGESFRDSSEFEIIHFYDTVKNSLAFSRIYKNAQQNRFDLFHLGKDGIVKVTHILKVIHSGILHTYALWLILGLLAMVLLFILI